MYDGEVIARPWLPNMAGAGGCRGGVRAKVSVETVGMLVLF
jgi:hypothetical protein